MTRRIPERDPDAQPSAHEELAKAKREPHQDAAPAPTQEGLAPLSYPARFRVRLGAWPLRTSPARTRDRPRPRGRAVEAESGQAIPNVHGACSGAVTGTPPRLAELQSMTCAEGLHLPVSGRVSEPDNGGSGKCAGREAGPVVDQYSRSLFPKSTQYAFGTP
jgi:hypothetical protein